LKFLPTSLSDAYVIELEQIEDERGFFERTWCEAEFAAHEINMCIKQCNVSFNIRKGTLRGLHWQAAPRAEAKLVRVTRGAIFDVIFDLRTDSATCSQRFAVELTAENHRALYIPAGFAHGFQTLMDDTEVFYQMSEIYSPEFVRGFRWDDPTTAIPWPVNDPIISERDNALPFLR